MDIHVLDNDSIRKLVLNNLDIILQKLNKLEEDTNSEKESDFIQGVQSAKSIILSYMNEKFYGEN